MHRTPAFLALAALTLGLAAPLTTLAQQTTPPPASSTAAPHSPMAEGDIRRIDKEAGKLTIKHGEIKSLDMPPMTMVFTVKDKSLLDNVKAGDKVRFQVIQANGQMVIIEIQVVH